MISFRPVFGPKLLAVAGLKVDFLSTSRRRRGRSGSSSEARSVPGRRRSNAEIEALAKRRLADEYDAAQERGEVAKHGGVRSKVAGSDLATAKDAGLTKQEIAEARTIRDAEKRGPGIVRRHGQCGKSLYRRVRPM